MKNCVGNTTFYLNPKPLPFLSGKQCSKMDSSTQLFFGGECIMYEVNGQGIDFIKSVWFNYACCDTHGCCFLISKYVFKMLKLGQGLPVFRVQYSGWSSEIDDLNWMAFSSKFCGDKVLPLMVRQLCWLVSCHFDSSFL